MANETLQEQFNTKLSSIHSRMNNVQSGAQLSNLRSSVGSLDAQVRNMPTRVQDLREKGYLFGRVIEQKAREFDEHWEKLCPQVNAQIDAQVPSLELELTRLTAQMAQIDAQASRAAVAMPMAERFEHTLNTFESRVSAAQRAIAGTYESFEARVNELDEELKHIEWMLQQLAEASFKLLPTEGALFAVEARWARDQQMDKNDPKGVLYLTDQRLLFEQKEEVATKKILFITTASEKVQNLLLEVPVAQVEKVETSKKGLFKNEDHLTISFKSGAPVQSAWFHLDGQDCALWQGYINLAVTHEYDDERIKPVDEAVVEKIRSAPSQCPNCGAPMSQPILRGQDTITCEYCQFVVRL